MMKNMVPATPEFATSKTFVWWDMDTCPVPNGYDPKRLAPRIDTELKKLGYNGPLTIIAVGSRLEGIPYDFLEALSSTGVVIKHAPWDSVPILEDLLESKSLEQAPVTIMLIAESLLMEAITSSLCKRDGGYNFLLAYPPSSPPENLPSSLVVCGEWLWDRVSLLKDSGSPEVTRGLVMGGETFSCETCTFDFPSFEDLITHLQSSKHARQIELEIKDMEINFQFSAAQEAEYRAQKKAEKLKIAAAKAKKKSKKTEGENQIPRRSKRLPQGTKLETTEKAESSLLKNPTTMAKKQSKAKKLKIQGEYMAIGGLLV